MPDITSQPGPRPGEAQGLCLRAVPPAGGLRAGLPVDPVGHLMIR